MVYITCIIQQYMIYLYKVPITWISIYFKFFVCNDSHVSLILLTVEVTHNN